MKTARALAHIIQFQAASLIPKVIERAKNKFLNIGCINSAIKFKFGERSSAIPFIIVRFIICRFQPFGRMRNY